MSDKIEVRVWARHMGAEAGLASFAEDETDTVTYSDTPENLQSAANSFRSMRGADRDYYANVAESIDAALADDAPVVIVDPAETPEE